MQSGQSPAPYPDLDARLQHLTDDALHFWGDAAVRRGALQAVLEAYIADDPSRLDAALRDVDEAVVAGMQALGFRRAPINAVRVRQIGALGRKSPLCNLDIDADELHRALTIVHVPDGIVATWVHESVHARKSPWDTSYATERRLWLGYEEGLAEGLTSLVSSLGSLSSGSLSYRRYRRAYELLADALGIPPDVLYRRFWTYAPGSIRGAFTDVIDDLYHERKGRRLTLLKRWDLLHLADEVFESSVQDVFDRVVERRIERDWRGRLP